MNAVATRLGMPMVFYAVCGPNGKANCTFIQNGATPVCNLAK
jgi:hypothetical protein